MNELIDHLHPNDSALRLYVAGGSYGTVAAQIMYGAPFDLFPHGRHIVSCLLLSPFSPFRWHLDYTKAMTWQNYISVGPPAQYIPFRLVPRMIAMLLQPKLKSVDKAEVLLHSLLFDRASSQEREAVTAWREREGLAEGQFEREMAENAVKSVSKTWAGFEECSDVLHADWGFRPDHLDQEHCERPILTVASTEDELGRDMATWLAHHYAHSSLRWIQGGHIAAVYELEEYGENDCVSSCELCSSASNRVKNRLVAG